MHTDKMNKIFCYGINKINCSSADSVKSKTATEGLCPLALKDFPTLFLLAVPDKCLSTFLVKLMLWYNPEWVRIAFLMVAQLQTVVFPSETAAGLWDHG